MGRWHYYSPGLRPNTLCGRTPTRAHFGDMRTTIHREGVTCLNCIRLLTRAEIRKYYRDVRARLMYEQQKL